MSDVTFNFNGKRALVTGAGRGIGREIAKALASSGAETFGLSKTLENLQSLVSEVPSIHPICVDVSDWEATRKAVEEIGKLDFLVNNAAIGGERCEFMDVTEAEMDSLFAVNHKAIVNISQVVAKNLIKANNPGSIVNISSAASSRALPLAGVYCTMKGALDQLTRVMASELGKHKIRVNSINPGFVYTDMSSYYVGKDSVKEIEAGIIAKVPLGKIADTSDMVGSVLFLLSDRAAMVNGSFLTIDGGMSTT